MKALRLLIILSCLAATAGCVGPADYGSSMYGYYAPYYYGLEYFDYGPGSYGFYDDFYPYGFFGDGYYGFFDGGFYGPGYYGWRGVRGFRGSGFHGMGHIFRGGGFHAGGFRGGGGHR